MKEIEILPIHVLLHLLLWLLLELLLFIHDRDVLWLVIMHPPIRYLRKVLIPLLLLFMLLINLILLLHILLVLLLLGLVHPLLRHKPLIILMLPPFFLQCLAFSLFIVINRSQDLRIFHGICLPRELPLKYFPSLLCL
jgi:hypothetical protein